MRTLTAPNWDVPALHFGHCGAHCHGDGDGIKVGGVRRQGEDGRFGRRGALSFHLDPVESAAEPHDSHDHSETHVYEPGAQQHG